MIRYTPFFIKHLCKLLQNTLFELTQILGETYTTGDGLKPLKFIAASFIASAVVANSSAADTAKQNDVNLWEIGVMANGFIEGSEGDELESSGAGGIRSSYFFSPQWSVNGAFMYAGNVGFNTGTGSTDIYRMLLTGSWHQQTTENSRAFFSAGTGYESFPEFSAKNGMVGVFGIGVRYLISDTYSVTAEAKYKMNLDHKDVAVLISLALNYRFQLDK